MAHHAASQGTKKSACLSTTGPSPPSSRALSDPAEAVVTKDLQLLSQISRNSEDDYFSNFMVNLLQLFSTDRKLLETRGILLSVNYAPA